jgi:hypothetical protein
VVMRVGEVERSVGGVGGVGGGDSGGVPTVMYGQRLSEGEESC